MDPPHGPAGKGRAAEDPGTSIKTRSNDPGIALGRSHKVTKHSKPPRHQFTAFRVRAKFQDGVAGHKKEQCPFT